MIALIVAGLIAGWLVLLLFIAVDDETQTRRQHERTGAVSLQEEA